MKASEKEEMKIIMSNSQINGIVSSSFANDYALAVADFTRYAIILFGCCCGCCCCFLRLFNRSICWLVIRIFGLDNMCTYVFLFLPNTNFTKNISVETDGQVQ